MPIGTKIIKVLKKPLSIAHQKKEKNKTLANSKLIVGKSQSILKLRELITKPQALKGTIKKYLDLRVKWRNKQFKVIMDSRAIRNYIVPKTVEYLGLLY